MKLEAAFNEPKNEEIEITLEEVEMDEKGFDEEIEIILSQDRKDEEQLEMKREFSPEITPHKEPEERIEELLKRETEPLFQSQQPEVVFFKKEYKSFTKYVSPPNAPADSSSTTNFSKS